MKNQRKSATKTTPPSTDPATVTKSFQVSCIRPVWVLNVAIAFLQQITFHFGTGRIFVNDKGRDSFLIYLWLSVSKGRQPVACTNIAPASLAAHFSHMP